MSTRLVLRDLVATDSGVTIGYIQIIDGVSGDVLRVAKATPELIRFLESVEVDLDVWYEIERMKEKNPKFTKLIQSLKLYT